MVDRDGRRARWSNVSANSRCSSAGSRRAHPVSIWLPRQDGEAVDDLVVAAPHVVLLVRRFEDPELAGPDVAEQVEHVEDALLSGRRRTRWCRRRRAAGRASTRGRPARRARSSRRSRAGRARGRAGSSWCTSWGSSRPRRPCGAAARSLQVGAHLVRACTRAVEVPARLGARGLGLDEVVEVEPERLHEVLRLRWPLSISSPPCS